MNAGFYSESDPCACLEGASPIAGRLRLLHETLREQFESLDRIAVALYEPQSGLVKTYIHSSQGESPLVHYETPLHQAPALQMIVDHRRARVVNNLPSTYSIDQIHGRKLLRQGYGSSYTVPIFAHGEFHGFIFCNSYQQCFFDDDVVKVLHPVMKYLGLSVVTDLQASRTLTAAINTLKTLSGHRDAETGGHLERMSRYARLIAVSMAEEYGLSDDAIEHIFLFAPLHDVGKISVPDEILLKPGKLTTEEFQQIKLHTINGLKIVNNIIDNFGMHAHRHATMLRNIVALHHEALDGSGYPYGLTSKDIPPEARITAVADIFDALLSARPYKAAMSVDAALRILDGMVLAGKVDARCVHALRNGLSEIDVIQARFAEEETC